MDKIFGVKSLKTDMDIIWSDINRVVIMVLAAY